MICFLKLLGLFFRFTNRKLYTQGKLKVLFTGQDIAWRSLPKYDGRSVVFVKGDALFEYVMSEIKKRGYISISTCPLSLKQYRPFSWFSSIRVYLEKMVLWDKLHVPSEWYFNVHVLYLRLLMLKYLFLVRNKLKRVNHSMLVKILFDKIVFPYLPLALEYLAYNFYLLDKLKPCAVVIRNEYGMWERSLILASKKLGILTIGIQHGIIHALHRGYRYDSDESPLFVDEFVVYGDKFKDLITESNGALADKIVVIGSPRYDGTLTLSHKVSSDVLRRIVFYKCGLKDVFDKKYKIMLWTTQTHAFSRSTAKRYIEDVCLAINDINREFNDKLLLLIKPHPGEKGTKNLYMSIIKSLNCNAKLLSKDSNVYELMIVSDILLTLNSTTALEFKVLGKDNVVLYNPINDKLASYYAKEGVGVEARNVKELKEILLQFVKCNLPLYSKRSGDFVNYYFNSVGCEATNSIANLIIEACNKFYIG